MLRKVSCQDQTKRAALKLGLNAGLPHRSETKGSVQGLLERGVGAKRLEDAGPANKERKPLDKLHRADGQRESH